MADVTSRGAGTQHADSLDVALRERGLRVCTVNRTLELLEEPGVVSHPHLTRGASTHHAVGRDTPTHLVCHQCCGIEQADVAMARTLTAQVLERHGFDTDLSHLSLHGRCAECMNR
jgi:Fur family ferric uptake transcriptional regulator